MTPHYSLRFIAAAVCAALIMLLSGCADQSSLPQSAPSEPPSRPVADRLAEAEISTVADTSAPEAAQTARQARPDRMIIQTAELTLEVPKFQEAYDRISAIAKRHNGFIAGSSSEADEENYKSGTITLRVPVDSFATALKDIGGVGEVLVKSIKGEDVTDEYVDIQARIRNLKREEERFLEVLNQARKVSDILLVEKELARVRGEIERMTARVLYLERQSALSTITVTLQEKRQIPLPMRSAWNFFNVTHEAANALLAVLKGLLTLFIWIVMFTPVWGAPLALLFWLRKRPGHKAHAP